MRNRRIRAIFSVPCQPLWPASAGGGHSPQVASAVGRTGGKDNLPPIQCPDGTKGLSMVGREPFRFPYRLEVLGKGKQVEIAVAERNPPAEDQGAGVGRKGWATVTGIIQPRG